MKYSDEYFQEQVKVFVKHGVRDHDGYIMLKPTLEKLGQDYNGGFYTAFARWLKRTGQFATHFRTGRGYTGQNGGVQSMPFGPRAKAMPFEEMKNPWVYEVVCSGSGRRYIGCSTKPYMRRAVHLYYLRNLDLQTTSNVFFGNEKVAEDVELYGPESFYMEVLEPIDRKTRGKTHPVEQKWIDYYGYENLYNMPKKESGQVLAAQVRDSFNAQLKQARKEYAEILEQLRRVKAEFGNLRKVVVSYGYDAVLKKRTEPEMVRKRGEWEELRRLRDKKNEEIREIREKRRGTRVKKVGTGRSRTYQVVTN